MSEPMQRYRLYQGALRPHSEGGWIRLADMEAPLDDDLNVLLKHCEDKVPLSLAEQRELFDWLEERDGIISDLQEKLDKADTAKEPT